MRRDPRSRACSSAHPQNQVRPQPLARCPALHCLLTHTHTLLCASCVLVPMASAFILVGVTDRNSSSVCPAGLCVAVPLTHCALCVRAAGGQPRASPLEGHPAGGRGGRAAGWRGERPRRQSGYMAVLKEVRFLSGPHDVRPSGRCFNNRRASRLSRPPTLALHHHLHVVPALHVHAS